MTATASKPVSPPEAGTIKGHYVWSAVGYWECRYCEHEVGCGHERGCLVRELDDANRWGGDQTNRLRESRYQTDRAIATVRGYFNDRLEEARGDAWHMLKALDIIELEMYRELLDPTPSTDKEITDG